MVAHRCRAPCLGLRQEQRATFMHCRGASSAILRGMRMSLSCRCAAVSVLGLAWFQTCV